jgi:TPR repeat protein
VVLTLLGIWLVPGDTPDLLPDSAQQDLRDATGTERADDAPSLLGEDTVIDSNADLSIALAPTEAGAGRGRPGSRARALIARLRTRGAVDLDAVHAAAVEAQADGETADAYLLYFFSAREGHAASAMALGTQADPASRDPANSVFEDADLNQAHKWYEVAVRNGDPQGQARLDDLRSRIDRLAAGGDPLAQRISLLWQ